jgi:cytochrome c553
MKTWVLFFSLCSTVTAYAAGSYKAGQEKSAICAACHGPTGISSNPLWPNLSGQHPSYLVKQLHDFKQKKGRYDPSMAAMVAHLSDQDIDDLSVFYSNQSIPEATTPQKYLMRGEQLYRGGDMNQHITACIACHGPKGHGNRQAGFPLVSGQHAAYTVLQLQAFKDLKRSNDFNAIMHDISLRMSSDDMTAVANYMAGLY